MFYNERTALIMQQLQLKTTVKTSKLAKILNVSIDTVRRDLKAMEQDGMLKYVHGSACLPDAMLAFSNFSKREIINIEKKRAAAIKAVKYIKQGDMIALNSGTTNVILAQEIAKRFSSLTVITNNIPAANILMQNASIETIILGGSLDALEHSTYGSACEQQLKEYFPDICFLSINSINKEAGYTDFRLHETGIIQAMSKNAKQVIAVMDSSKLDRQSKKIILEKQNIDFIVMDETEPSLQEQYAAAGIIIK